VIDPRVPLACGGADAPANMRWQTTAEGKAKDRTEGQAAGDPRVVSSEAICANFRFGLKQARQDMPELQSQDDSAAELFQMAEQIAYRWLQLRLTMDRDLWNVSRSVDSRHANNSRIRPQNRLARHNPQILDPAKLILAHDLD
jgi:hypothetical protein